MSSPIQLHLLNAGDLPTFLKCVALATTFARGRGRPQTEVQSIVYAAIDDLLQALQQGKPLADAKAEVNKAVRRVCDRRRKQRMRWIYGVNAFLPDHRLPSPATACEHRELVQIVYALLQDLPEPNRGAMTAILIDGRASQSVAEQFGIKPATLRKQLARTRKKIQSELALLTRPADEQ